MSPADPQLVAGAPTGDPAVGLRQLRIGIDTGGTFTDVVLIDPETGRLWTAKTSSTPDDPSRGFGAGIGEVLGLSGVSAAEIARVLHGTTVATNLILEGKGAACALITSAGFKYVLEIGRQEVPRRASLFAWVKPKRPVPAASRAAAKRRRSVRKRRAAFTSRPENGSSRTSRSGACMRAADSRTRCRMPFEKLDIVL